MTVWYIARGAGLAALVLLTLSTCIGALMTGRASASRRIVANYLHRVTTATGLAALALHVGAILADPWARVGWKGAIVPFTAGYRPTWIGLGTLAVLIFVLVGAIGAARGRLAASARAARVWRGLHGLAYVGFVLAMVHGLKSGTDTGVGWVTAIYLACGLAVSGAVGVRVASARRTDLVRVPIAPVTTPYAEDTRVLAGAATR